MAHRRGNLPADVRPDRVTGEPIPSPGAREPARAFRHARPSRHESRHRLPGRPSGAGLPSPADAGAASRGHGRRI
jgi:hypothetical protein